MKISHDATVSSRIKKGLADKGITTRSLVAFFVFGMIVLVFVLSDLSGRNKGSSEMGSAAVVNGELISLKDFQDEEDRLAQYYSQLFGGQFDSEMQRNMLRGEVMNGLVTKSAAAQAAEIEGIYATDAEVRNMIVTELPYFKKDGVFQSDVYKSLLQANRLTPSEFEGKLRKDIKNQRSRQLFESSLVMTELQKSIEKELGASKLNLEFIQLSSIEYAKVNPVGTEEAIRALLQDNFKKKVEDYFKSNQTKYATPEQIKASHILIKIDGVNNAENDIKARKKAEEILQRLRKEDFGKVAAQVSDDPGSKLKNGELGFFSKGQMVKEFDEVAFTLPIGKISGLVKTTFGYHLIKVTEKKPAYTAHFESVKYDIAKKLIADEKYLNFVKSIESDLVSGKPSTLTAQLQAAKLNWRETGYFDIAAEAVPVMNSTQAMSVALSLTHAQPVAKKLVREGDVQFLIKLKDIKSDQIDTSKNTTKATDLKEEDQSLIEKQRSMDVYQAWVESFKKSARIETNSSLTNIAK